MAALARVKSGAMVHVVQVSSKTAHREFVITTLAIPLVIIFARTVIASSEQLAEKRYFTIPTLERMRHYFSRVVVVFL